LGGGFSALIFFKNWFYVCLLFSLTLDLLKSFAVFFLDSFFLPCFKSKKKFFQLTDSFLKFCNGCCAFGGNQKISFSIYLNLKTILNMIRKYWKIKELVLLNPPNSHTYFQCIFKTYSCLFLVRFFYLCTVCPRIVSLALKHIFCFFSCLFLLGVVVRVLDVVIVVDLIRRWNQLLVIIMFSLLRFTVPLAALTSFA